MSVVPAAQVKVYMADGGFSHPVDRGRFVGGGFAWDAERARFRDFDVHLPTAAQAPDPTLTGIVYDDALKAIILNWRIKPQDIDEDFWLGPVVDPKTGARMRTLYPDPNSAGRWRIVRPGGNYGVRLLQQYYAGEGEWALSSYNNLEANPKFAVSLFREWTPGDESFTAADTPPWIHTGIRFGGVWQLQLPKWRRPTLHKLVGGSWRPVASGDWDTSPLYGDSYGDAEQFIVIKAIDGRLVFRGGPMGDAWVYSEARPINVAAAPITFCGNSGCATFGLHDIEFAQGEWNLLRGATATTLDVTPAGMPESIVTGAKPAGTYARAYMAAWDGSEITEPTRTFYLGVGLYSQDGTDTPVVRCAGLDFAPVTEAGPQRFIDVSGRFIEGSGGWECDLERRCVTQQYTIRLDNSDGFFDGTRANRLIRVALGRPGTEELGPASSWVNGGPAMHFTAVCRMDQHDAASEATRETRVVTLDRLDILDEIECGDRAPQDGMTVAAAMREALSWGHVRPAEIGEIYDSGHKLPGSTWARSEALADSATDVSGVLDLEAGAACKPRPDVTVLRWLQYLMGFDYNTFMLFDDVNLFHYVLLSGTALRTFRVTDSPAAEDEIRRELRRRPRLGEGKTSVIVGGRERSTGRPLSSRACDQSAWRSVGSRRFRGYDVTEREHNEALSTQGLCNLRCRHRFDWARRVRDLTSVGLIGQRLIPTWRVTVAGQDCYVLSIDEEFDRTGRWDMTAEMVSAQ